MKQLDDITLYYPNKDEESKRFTSKQNVVSDLYLHFLDGYKPPKTSRISIILSDFDYIKGYSGSVLTVNAKFDIDFYRNQSDQDQNRMILDTIHRITALCAKEFNWDLSPFENAFKKVNEANFTFKIELPAKLSRNKKYKASILVEKNEEEALIFALFYNNQNELIKEVELLKTFNWSGFYKQLVKKYKWFDNSSFGFSINKDQLIIKADLNEKKQKVLINPINNTKEEIEGFLRQITFKAFKSEKEKIKWMNS